MTAGIVANGLRLRARVGRLAVLDETPTNLRLVGQDQADRAQRSASDGLAGTLGSDLDGDYGVLVAAGVEVDDDTMRAAVRYARANDLDVLDLVPGDLPLERLHELIRLVEPGTYRDDRLVGGRGACQATLVRTGLLDQLALARNRTLDPVQYVETMLQLKRYAPTSTDLVVAPGLRAGEIDPAWRIPRARALYGSTMPGFLGVPAVEAGLLTAAPVLGRTKGLAAFAAYVAQPFVITAGGPIKPRDVRVATALGRPGRVIANLVQAAQATEPQSVRHRADLAARENETRRIQYARLADRAEEFFEPRRATCPLCEGDELHRLLEVPDLMQGKPGRFQLDECGGCGHIFQNPRLSIEGLDYYYRDFYDGLGDEDAEFVFSMGSKSYRGRAAMLQGVAKPKRWLDVGGGHGHFCLLASEMWPDTIFDCLDLSDSVIEAEKRGWIDRAYKGLFPDLAPELTGSYDVVSMHHYLEHTREPLEELDAAHIALEKGGHVLIEVPDPDSRLGRALGWMWGSWFQPQHQHFVSLDNLCTALEERDFTVVSSERGPAHQAVDLAFSLWLVAGRIAPAGNQPWSPPQTMARRVGRAATWTVFAPLLAAALIADQAIAPVLRRLPKMTNTYRVLARKN
ncbi:MAG TPA: class I SAM-dependent methyltransferase [Acidimicrobiales bacterium]